MANPIVPKGHYNLLPKSFDSSMAEDWEKNKKSAKSKAIEKKKYQVGDKADKKKMKPGERRTTDSKGIVTQEN